MRRYGLPEPYEQLKALTRGVKVTPDDVHAFVSNLGLPPEAEKRLLELTPASYTGLAADLVEVGRNRTATEDETPEDETPEDETREDKT
jgi:hypothetical protein